MHKLHSKNHILKIDEINLRIEEEKELCGYPERILRVNSVAKLFDVSRATVKVWRDKGILPPPLRFNQAQTALGWTLSSILAVQKSMVPVLNKHDLARMSQKECEQ